MLGRVQRCEHFIIQRRAKDRDIAEECKRCEKQDHSLRGRRADLFQITFDMPQCMINRLGADPQGGCYRCCCGFESAFSLSIKPMLILPIFDTYVKSNKVSYSGGYGSIGSNIENPYKVKLGGKDHDISWLVG